jgi:tetratricopeptide (TPR) repeat protein
VKVLKGRYGQALPYLEHALEIDSQDDRTRYYLGLALYALESREEAAEEFEKVILTSSDPALIDQASDQLRLMGP